MAGINLNLPKIATVNNQLMPLFKSIYHIVLCTLVGPYACTLHKREREREKFICTVTSYDAKANHQRYKVKVGYPV